MKKLIISLCFLLLGVQISYAQSARILMEGNFEDWQEQPAIYSDPIGDQQWGDIDFGNLKIANDERFVFFYVEVNEEINLQSDNSITLFLDTDNNSNTGISKNGIGAELKFIFGQRSGTFVYGGYNYTIYHNYIGLVTSPTVTSTIFEIAIDRTKSVYGHPLFPQNSFKVVFSDEGTGHDLLPDAGDFISYSFDVPPVEPLSNISLQKAPNSHFRLLSYNVLSDGFFQPDLYDEFDRILSAIDPDIIGFEEIYDHTPQETAQRVEQMLPSEPGEQWYYSERNDCQAISRFPIVQTNYSDGNGCFLSDMNPVYDCQMLLIVAHLPAGDNNESRQLEIDKIMAFIRDAKAGIGWMDLQENTPIIISGDMNLVGYAQQLETLLTGEIINQQYGPSFEPDWDGTDFGDLTPRQTNLPMFYTWNSSTSSYCPGRLDFMIYSDYVLWAENSFVLYTPEMPADTLFAYGLLANDTPTASDHLPTVGDYRIIDPAFVESQNIQAVPQSFFISNYPNPFNPTTTIQFEIPDLLGFENLIGLKLAIYDITGKLVKTLLNEPKESGYYSVIWNGRDDKDREVASGVYFYRLEIAARGHDPLLQQTKRMILLR